METVLDVAAQGAAVGHLQDPELEDDSDGVLEEMGHTAPRAMRSVKLRRVWSGHDLEDSDGAGG